MSQHLTKGRGCVIISDMETTTKLTKAPYNNRFNAVPGIRVNSKRERGERLEDAGNGMQRLYVDGRYIALIPKEN